MEKIQCIICCEPMIELGKDHHDHRPVAYCQAGEHKVCRVCAEVLLQGNMACPKCRGGHIKRIAVDTDHADLVQFIVDGMGGAQQGERKATIPERSIEPVPAVALSERQSFLARVGLQFMQLLQHPDAQIERDLQANVSIEERGLIIAFPRESGEYGLQIVGELRRAFGGYPLFEKTAIPRQGIRIASGVNFAMLLLFMGFSWREIEAYIRTLHGDSLFINELRSLLVTVDPTEDRHVIYLENLHAALERGGGEIPLIPMRPSATFPINSSIKFLRMVMCKWLKNHGERVEQAHYQEVPQVAFDGGVARWGLNFLYDHGEEKRLYITGVPNRFLEEVQGHFIAHNWVVASALSENRTEGAAARQAERRDETALYLEGEAQIAHFLGFLGIHGEDIAAVLTGMIF